MNEATNEEPPLCPPDPMAHSHTEIQEKQGQFFPVSTSNFLVESLIVPSL